MEEVNTRSDLVAKVGLAIHFSQPGQHGAPELSKLGLPRPTLGRRSEGFY
jgi:hypothetical protein